MKVRRISLWLLALLMVLSLSIPVAAEEDDSQAKLKYVTDTAGLLTADQKNALSNRAAEISKEYATSIYIIAVQDYTKYSQETDIGEACADIYDEYELGWGEDRSGVVLLLDMEERDYYFLFNGSWVNFVFSESVQEALEDQVLSYLSDNDYYGGFNQYLNGCQEYLADASEATSVGEGDGTGEFEFSFLFFLPGLFAAGVYAIILIIPMHSSGVKTRADDYIVPGSMHLTRQSDHFLRRTVSRTPRQKEQDNFGHSSHSSGSSVTRSGRGGKF